MMVFEGDRHVGHMSWAYARGMSHAVFRKVDAIQPICFNPATDTYDPRMSEVKEIVVSIGRRRMEFDGFELEQASFLNTSRAPKDQCIEMARRKLGRGADFDFRIEAYEFFHNAQKHSYILEWRVLEVTPEQHEELFDMDQFEPV